VVPYLAAANGDFEFIRFRAEQGDSHTLTSIKSGEILDFITLSPREWQPGLFQFLDFCLRHGAPVTPPKKPGKPVFWPTLLENVIMGFSHGSPVAYIVLLLRHVPKIGSLRFRFFSGMIYVEPTVTVFASWQEAWKNRWCFELPVTSEFAQLAASKGWQLSFRDLIPLWLPEHADFLEGMIDENLAGAQMPTWYEADYTPEMMKVQKSNLQIQYTMSVRGRALDEGNVPDPIPELSLPPREVCPYARIRFENASCIVCPAMPFTRSYTPEGTNLGDNLIDTRDEDEDLPLRPRLWRGH
jgi:hypothetical protein